MQKDKVIVIVIEPNSVINITAQQGGLLYWDEAEKKWLDWFSTQNYYNLTNISWLTYKKLEVGYKYKNKNLLESSIIFTEVTKGIEITKRRKAKYFTLHKLTQHEQEILENTEADRRYLKAKLYQTELEFLCSLNKALSHI